MNSNRTRRDFIQTLGAFAFLGGCAQAIAPAPTSTKPGAVWLNMNQDELDAAYTQRVWAPNQAEVLARYKTASESFRAKTKPALRLPYGPGTDQGMDVWVPDTPTGKVLIFVHGGAWSGGRASEYSFLAEPYLKAGVHFVIPDFPTVQEASGNLEILVTHVLLSAVYCASMPSYFGTSPSIFVSGHSSGAHLAGVVLTTDWGASGLDGNIFKGGVLCSGMYDLKPVRLSSRSRYIKFDDNMEGAMSPQRHLEHLDCPVLLAYGMKESPEFKRQSKDFGEAIEKAGKQVQTITPDLNHFEILETMAQEESTLTKAVMQMMK